jgi:hypothetical protein
MSRMADGNGKDNTQRRLEALEQMDKLLLRAQVLQQDALEQLEKTVRQHAEWQERHEKYYEQWKRQADERERRLDERIEKLVLSIGDLISRIPPQSLR